MTLEEIRACLGPRLKRALSVAEAALPEQQFRAFRKVMLDEMGDSGLLGDLQKGFDAERRRQRQGMDGK